MGDRGSDLGKSLGKGKPSDKENEYFRRKDAELLEAARKRHQEETKKAEEHAKKRRCPACNAPMDPINYEDHAVEIDKCLECSGIYLDDGELEQILSMSKEGSPRLTSSILAFIKGKKN